MVGREAQDVELEHDRADEVEGHLGVDAAIEELRVLEPAEEQLFGQALAGARGREHDPEREQHADRARAREPGDAVVVEPVVGQPLELADGDPREHGEHQDPQAVEAVAQAQAGLGIADVALDLARGDRDVEGEDRRVDREGRQETREVDPVEQVDHGGPESTRVGSICGGGWDGCGGGWTCETSSACESSSASGRSPMR